MKQITFALLVLALFISGCSRSSSLITDEVSREEIMLLHNRERSINKLEQLEHSQELEDRAQEWAEWMASRASLKHGSLRGTSFNYVGENIAMGYTDPDTVVEGWMDSRGHRQNILNPKFTHAGFGYAREPDGRAYWCSQFGGN